MSQIFLILLSVTICWAVPSDIDRPCRLNDHRCIGAIFASNSNCKLNLAAKINNEYTVEKLRFVTPYFNTSYIDKNLKIRNHDRCSIATFFINRKTQNAVLGIECRKLFLESDRTVIQHRSFDEDNVYNYHVRATYPVIRMTINLPTTSRINLCELPVYTEVPQMPIFHVDPKDRPTAKALSKDDSLQLIFERENFFFRGYPLARMFIGSRLCDFGCPRGIL